MKVMFLAEGSGTRPHPLKISIFKKLLPTKKVTPLTIYFKS